MSTSIQNTTPTESASSGDWQPRTELVEAMRPFHERRINVHTHCNGDLTIDLWIDVVEQLLLESAWLDHRYTVQHSQLTLLRCV